MSNWFNLARSRAWIRIRDLTEVSAVTNPFHHFWLFVYAVGDHAVTLAAGCVITVLLGILEKRILKRPVPVKAEIGILLAFVFFACFQAWRDEFETASKVTAAASPVQITNQVSVPPATVVVQKVGPAISSDLNGILQIDKLEPATDHNEIAEGKTIEVNVVYKNVGTQPLHAKFSYEGIGFVSTSVPHAEEDARKHFTEARKKQLKSDLASKFAGSDVGVNIPVYRTAVSSALTQAQADGIMDGSGRIYLMVWATWKDSHNQSGKFDACYFLQQPSTRTMTSNNAIWHTCE
jgi:hypothetical protein